MKLTSFSKRKEVVLHGTLLCRAVLSLWSLQTHWGLNPSLTPLPVWQATLASLSTLILHCVRAEGVVWWHQLTDENRTTQHQTMQEAGMGQPKDSEPWTRGVGPKVRKRREFGPVRANCGQVTSESVEWSGSKGYLSKVGLHRIFILAAIVPSGHQNLVLFLVQGSHLSHGN